MLSDFDGAEEFCQFFAEHYHEVGGLALRRLFDNLGMREQFCNFDVKEFKVASTSLPYNPEHTVWSAAAIQTKLFKGLDKGGRA